MRSYHIEQCFLCGRNAFYRLVIAQALDDAYIVYASRRDSYMPCDDVYADIQELEAEKAIWQWSPLVCRECSHVQVL